ncbi:MAG: formate dehydrogenase accessory sulfurtransferase FdhD [Chloroflexota bacterium]
MRRAVGSGEYLEDGLTEQAPLAEEAPVTLTVNNREVATLLCTPRDLRDLAVGWLYAEGFIESAAEILSLSGCAHDRELSITTVRNLNPEDGGHWRLVTSGCGAGARAGALRTEGVPRVASGLTVSLAQLRAWTAAMVRSAKIYRTSGGVHCAALAGPGGILVQREDIGRHSAVDKVIGHALANGLDFVGFTLLATGRLSSEMAWKAARAGIPVAASLSIPSDLARDIAEAAGVALVGRVASNRPWIYSHPERIVS